jgi:hypothetical protein
VSVGLPGNHVIPDRDRNRHHDQQDHNHNFNTKAL